MNGKRHLFFLLSWLAFGACHPSFLLLSSLSSAVAAAAAAVDAGLSCFCWSWVTVWAACVRSVAAGTCSTYSLPKRRRCGFRLVVGLFAWTGIPKSPSLTPLIRTRFLRTWHIEGGLPNVVDLVLRRSEPCITTTTLSYGNHFVFMSIDDACFRVSVACPQN